MQNKIKQEFAFHAKQLVADMLRLTRRKGASIDNVGSLLLDLLVGLGERRTRQGHQAGPGGLKDTKGGNELHERVDTVRLGGAIVKLKLALKETR